MSGDASDLYSRRWRRWIGTGAWRHAVRQQFHKQERAAAKAQLRKEQ